MSTTIKDVAKEAGVSIATVSKVINGKPSISEPTRLRVLEVIKQLNYHPNAQACNFARERSLHSIIPICSKLCPGHKKLFMKKNIISAS